MARVQHMPRTTLSGEPILVDGYSESLPERIVWWIAGVIEAILALRFVFSLLGANTANPIANFIYDISHPFVAPFFNLFNYNVVNYGVSRFEVYTLVAMLFYGLVGWLIASLFGLTRRY